MRKAYVSVQEHLKLWEEIVKTLDGVSVEKLYTIFLGWKLSYLRVLSGNRDGCGHGERNGGK